MVDVCILTPRGVVDQKIQNLLALLQFNQNKVIWWKKILNRPKVLKINGDKSNSLTLKVLYNKAERKASLQQY